MNTKTHLAIAPPSLKILKAIPVLWTKVKLKKGSKFRDSPTFN